MKSTLRRRWTQEQAEEAMAALQTGRPFSRFGDSIDDRGQVSVDLRGLPIGKPLHDCPIENVDLSFCAFEQMGQFVDVSASSCIFDGATMDTNMSGIFETCSFVRARMQGATFFGVSSYAGCSFEAADLRRAHGGLVTFRSCDFTRANMRGVHFSKCVFEDCKWAGVQFQRSSLGGSRITREGFPFERGETPEGAPLPDVILDGVQWS
jgi:uncharacterized protein YjbI with pentapeptide repeats